LIPGRAPWERGEIVVAESRPARHGNHRGWVRAAVVAAAVVIAAHGLVHLMGVVLLGKLGEPGQLRYADAVPAPGSTAGYLVGGLWLAAAAAFVIAAVLLAAGRASWRIVALAAATVSAPVIGLAPGQAIVGLVVDGVVLIGVAASWPRTWTVPS
jgi:hypothetical protein